MRQQRCIRIVMLIAWAAIMYLGTTAYHHLYASYPKPCVGTKSLQTPRELWTRSFFSSIQLFAFNIDSNAVDGWKQESKDHTSAVSTQLHVAAICAGIWTVFFIVLLLFKSWWMWLIRHLFSRWIRKDLYVFWGVNRRSIQLAHELGESVGWRNILFVVQPVKEYEDTTEGLKNILQKSKYRNALQQQIGSVKASILITRRPIAELSNLSYWTAWLKMGISPMGRYIMRTTSHIHVLLLGEDEVQNINVALLLSSASLWPTFYPFKSRELTIHCHARRSNINRAIEDIAVTKRIKVIDSSHLAVELLKKDVQNHPVSFVTLSEENPGTVASAFHSLIVGFSETGQDALRFLYEFGAFVDASCGKEEDTRSPFYCDIVDAQLDASAARWMNHASGVFHENATKGIKQIRFHQMDYRSKEFYEDILSPILPALNYVVIAIGDDRAGITLAVDILRYAIKTERVHYVQPDNKFCIYVRSYDPNTYAFMNQVADHYNQNGNNIFIRIFGAEQMIYTKSMLIDEELLRAKEKYEKNYNEVKEKTFKENYTDGPKKPEEETALYKNLNKSRAESQNFANALHLKTKKYIKQHYEPHQVPLLRLAQTEHLRWWAAHEIMGYRSDSSNNEGKCILHYVHNCMKPWKDIHEARKYDFLTFSTLYNQEEIAQAIQLNS